MTVNSGGAVDGNRGRHLTDEQIMGVRAEFDTGDRRARGAVEPGMRGVVIAGAVLVLIAAMILPHAGGASGWDVLLFDAKARGEAATFPLRLFTWVCVIAGIAFSVSALLLRRWVLVWAACLGCGLASFLGLFAVWTRQTLLVGHAGGGPGAGMLLAWAAVGVIAYQWLRLAWSRAGVPTR